MFDAVMLAHQRIMFKSLRRGDDIVAIEPARLRMNVREVSIEPFGEGFIVQPERTPKNDLGEWLREFYATTEPLPADFLAEREDAAPQERDWS